MHWIYLSPHFDDVALSCGGLVWEQNNAGDQASIWTICAGDPSSGKLSDFAESLHSRWETPEAASAERRREDQVSCRALKADYFYYDLPDCIYRPGGKSGKFYYASEEAIFGPVHPEEQPLVAQLTRQLIQAVPADAALVCPLTLGGHVDHRLTRLAAEAIGIPLLYYADYPYVVSLQDPFASLCSNGWVSDVFFISSAGLAAWQDSIAAHRSQISTFWPDLDAMRTAIREYCQREAGIRLWRSKRTRAL